MRRRFIAWVLAAGAFACSRVPEATPEPAKGAGSEPLRSVSVAPELLTSGRIAVAPARRASPRLRFTATGEIVSSPDGAAEIGSPVAARVREISAREGDRIEKGARLAVLEAAEVARTSADLERARSRRQRAESILSQEEQLIGERATSERNVVEAKSELSAAQAEQRGAEALLSTFGAQPGGKIVLKSPISGTVVRRSIVLGAPVTPGDALFRIVDASRLVVRADVPEGRLDGVVVGAPAIIGWPGRSVSCAGTVQTRAPSVDPARRTVPFLVRPGEGCPELVEGAFVDVAIERSGEAKDAMVAVPRDAVVELEGTPIVFVSGDQPGQFTAQTVRVGRLDAETAYIEDGVKEGASVVVHGAILLKGELMRAALE